MQGFLAALHARGNARSSTARKLSAVRTFVRHLRREGAIDGDPGALVAAPRLDQTLPVHLTEDEMARLVETPDTGSPLGRRDRAILELFYASGLRLSELVGLDLDDVNLSSRMVRVLGKGRRERLVPFNRSAAQALQACVRDRELILRGGLLADGARTASALDAEREAVRRAHGLPRRRAAPREAPLFLNYRGGRLGARSVHRLVPLRAAVQQPVRDQPARPSSFVRDAPAAAGRRPAGHPGACSATCSSRRRSAIRTSTWRSSWPCRRATRGPEPSQARSRPHRRMLAPSDLRGRARCVSCRLD